MTRQELIEAKKNYASKSKELYKLERETIKKRYALRDEMDAVELRFVEEHAKFKKGEIFRTLGGEISSVATRSIQWDDDGSGNHAIMYGLKTNDSSRVYSENEIVTLIEAKQLSKYKEGDIILKKTLRLDKVVYLGVVDGRNRYYGISARKNIMVKFSCPDWAGTKTDLSERKALYLWRLQSYWALRGYVSPENPQSKEWYGLFDGITIDKCVVGKEEMVAELL